MWLNWLAGIFAISVSGLLFASGLWVGAVVLLLLGLLNIYFAVRYAR